MDRDDSDSSSAAVIELASTVCAYLKRKKEKRNELQDALMSIQSFRVDLSPLTVEMVKNIASSTHILSVFRLNLEMKTESLFKFLFSTETSLGKKKNFSF